MNGSDFVRFGDIAKVTDYVANGSFAALKENVTYRDQPDHAILIRLVDFKSSWSGPFVYVDKHSFEFLSKSIVKPGDVVISNVGANAGTVFRVPNLGQPMTLGPNSVLLKDLSVPDFWYYFFSSHEGKHALDGIIAGSAQPKFNKTDLRNLMVPVFSENDQARIASILNVLDEKVELNRRMAATLEEAARALYRSWFVDFDPVQAKAEGLVPAYMDEATAALFPDRFGDDGLPEGWEIIPLSSLCVQVKNSIDPRKHTGQIFDHYSLPAFDTGKGPVREFGSLIQSQKLVIPTEAILFSRLNPSTPRIWWARTSDQVFASVASTEFLIAVARNKEDMPFLYSLFFSDGFRGDVIARVTGTSNSHQRVKPASVLEIEIVGASSDIRKAYGRITSPWFERVYKLSQENQTLASLRDTLLPKLMSGELQVSEARKKVEEAA